MRMKLTVKNSRRETVTCLSDVASNVDRNESEQESAELVCDDSADELAARLIAATLHLMSTYAQCACPKLAVIVEAHIAELALVAPDARVRAVCASLKNSWMQKRLSHAVSGNTSENISPTELQSIASFALKFQADVGASGQCSARDQSLCG